MKAILGIIVMIGIACMVLASIMAIQSTPLTANDAFIVGITLIVIGAGLKG